MAVLGLVLVVLGLASCSVGQFVDPFQPGPHDVQLFRIYKNQTDGLVENLDVWVPMSSGLFPILYYLDGFAMGTPGVAYQEILRHQASHGILVIAPWMRSYMTPEDKLPYFRNVTDWVEINIENFLHANGVPGDAHYDYQTLLAGAHSAGSHVLVSYLKESCGNFKGIQLSDPVDGADPLGLIPEFCITPGETLNFNIPVLHISAGYDPVPGAAGLACAPEDMSNERFWNAFNPDSHRWSINATEFSHGDLMTEEYRLAMQITGFCGYNEALTDNDYVTYLQWMAGTMTAFYKSLVEENCWDYLQYLEDPSLMLISATERHVNPTGECPRLSCSWTPAP